MTDTFKIDLSPEEVNKVLAALGNLPYLQVHDLISNIRSQAENQLKIEKDQNEAAFEAQLSS